MGTETANESSYTLLVEDDLSVREFVGECLAATGHKVLQARSGSEGIEVFKKHQSEISLVLSDIVMPGLFGDQMALRLLELNPALKVILMSGNTPTSLESGIPLKAGENFLQKPFSIQELKDCIQRKLGSR